MSGVLPFPDNIVEVLKSHLAAVDGVTEVITRMMEPTDANGTLSVVCDMYVPEEMQMGSFDPAAGTYKFMLAHLVKNTDGEDGNRTHRVVAKAIRLMLYRDTALRVALGQLREGEDPIERVLTWDISTQRFGSTDITGQFVYLSVTELNIHTETV